MPSHLGEVDKSGLVVFGKESVWVETVGPLLSQARLFKVYSFHQLLSLGLYYRCLD